MVLELHLWGPAFSLPSFDARCLAALAYLKQSVPQDQWVVVASSSPALSPTNELPALRDGDVWIGGFRSIINHIRERSSGLWDLDAELGSQQRAVCTAFISFLEYNGQPLLDLSLFVSSQNFTSLTRPLFSTFLSWPASHLLSHKQRATAKLRSNHLKLSTLDIDNVGSDGVDAAWDPASQLPKGLLKGPKATVSSLLKQPEHASRIRLEALAAAFFEPLADLRSGKQYFLTEGHPSSLDCLIFGYLAIAVYSEPPQSWLGEVMRLRHSKLLGFVHENRRAFTGDPVEIGTALCHTRGPGTLDIKEPTARPISEQGPDRLPWVASVAYTAPQLGILIAEEALGLLPSISHLRRALQYDVLRDKVAGKEEPTPVGFQSLGRDWSSHTSFWLGVTGIIGAISLMLYSGIPASISDKRNPSSLQDLGEAGTALAVLAEEIGEMNGGF